MKTYLRAPGWLSVNPASGVHPARDALPVTSPRCCSGFKPTAKAALLPSDTPPLCPATVIPAHPAKHIRSMGQLSLPQHSGQWQASRDTDGERMLTCENFGSNLHSCSNKCTSLLLSVTLVFYVQVVLLSKAWKTQLVDCLPDCRQ